MTQEAKAAAPSLVEYFSAFGPVETSQLSRVQAATAKIMTRNAQSIPHVTQHDEVEITRLDAVIRERKGSGGRHSILAYLFKACVEVLRAMPHFNASLDQDGVTLVLKRYVNIGMAVDTPQGLLVPVIRDVDGKSVLELAEEIRELSARAREKGLPYAAMEGSSFTISSLGAIGGTGFTPIINAPDVAILGVSKARLRPVFAGDQVRPALMLPLSLSYDHRVINGADAARFLVALGASLDALCDAPF